MEIKELDDAYNKVLKKSSDDEDLMNISSHLIQMTGHILFILIKNKFIDVKDLEKIFNFHNIQLKAYIVNLLTKYKEEDSEKAH